MIIHMIAYLYDELCIVDASISVCWRRHCFVVDTVRWLWGTFVQAFLDRDGAVGSLPDGFPYSRDRPGYGSMGTHGHGCLKLGPCPDLGLLLSFIVTSLFFQILHTLVPSLPRLSEGGYDRSCPQPQGDDASAAVPMPSSVNEMMVINLDAGLRPVSFYPADDDVPVAVLGMGGRCCRCHGWMDGRDCDDPHALTPGGTSPCEGEASGCNFQRGLACRIRTELR